MHIYKVRPRNDRRDVDLISDLLPFGRLWYDTPDNAIGYAMHSGRSHDAVIRIHDDAGTVTETHEHNGRFQRVVKFLLASHFSLQSEGTNSSETQSMDASRECCSDASEIR